MDYADGPQCERWATPDGTGQQPHTGRRQPDTITPPVEQRPARDGLKSGHLADL
ncbi:MAG: hypothetical protein QOI36_3939 [Pseudonocardiales bacterium]|jgi:hypothetical protein|nr:hypothetical protein [Pseudonocardiales bacterium]